MSMTSPTLAGTDWYNLSAFQSGLVVSLSLFGALLGSGAALLWGDRLGRKRELLLASALYGAGALVVAAAPGLPTVMVGRLAYGVGIGFAMHAAPAYIAGARGRACAWADRLAGCMGGQACFGCSRKPAANGTVGLPCRCRRRDQPATRARPADQSEGGLHCGGHPGWVRRLGAWGLTRCGSARVGCTVWRRSSAAAAHHPRSPVYASGGLMAAAFTPRPPHPPQSINSYAASYVFVEQLGGWRWMYGVAAAPSLLLALGALGYPGIPLPHARLLLLLSGLLGCCSLYSAG